MKRLYLSIAVAALIIVAVAGAIQLYAASITTITDPSIVVLDEVYDFTNASDLSVFMKYVYNTVNGSLGSWNSSVVALSVSDGFLKIVDLNADDGIVPVLMLPVQSGKVYVLKGLSGSCRIIAGALNTTNTTLAEVVGIDVTANQYVELHIYDDALVVVVDGYPIKVENAAVNTVALMGKAGSGVQLDALLVGHYIEPETFTPLHQWTGSGQGNTYTISVAQGARVQIRLEPQHADYDIFVAKPSNQHFSEFSHTLSWMTLYGYADYRSIRGGTAVDYVSFTANEGGTYKIVVKLYSSLGSSSDDSYRLSANVQNSNTNSGFQPSASGSSGSQPTAAVASRFSWIRQHIVVVIIAAVAALILIILGLAAASRRRF